MRALLLLFSRAAAFAQPSSYSLTGKLVLHNRVPVAHAEISIAVSGTNDIRDVVFTDSRGLYVSTR